MILIANPAAGGGRVGREWSRIQAELREVFGPLDAVLTERRGHATDLARDAVEGGHDAVLSLGGDGTHSEIAAGLAEIDSDRRPRLGVLHGGTGGDFTRMLGRGTLREQALRLRDEAVYPIDLARVKWHDDDTPRSRVFLNEVSFGMSATICDRVNQGNKRLGGTVTFLGQTLRTLLDYRPQEVRMTLDDHPTIQTGEARTILACNGQWAGGGMHFAPKARLADGLLDVVVLNATSLRSSARMLRGLYAGDLLDLPTVDHYPVKRLQLDGIRSPLLIEADGEVLGLTPAEVEIIPHAIELMGAPESSL